MGVLNARLPDGSFVPILGGGGSYVPLSGGTMTGFLTLNAAPTATLHAVTKGYVDTKTYAWTSITGKPTTFTPADHTHPWSEVTGKPSVYNPASHGHSWGDIDGKPSLAANPHGDGAHTVQYAIQGHGDPAHSENYSKVGHTHNYAPDPHGNARHDPAFMPVTGGTFSGAVVFDGACNVSTNNFQYNQGRKDSDNNQPTLRVYASGVKYIWEHTSSLAWKRDVVDLDDMDAVEVIRGIRPVRYTSMHGASLEEAELGNSTIGLIAEEVDAVIPEAVSRDDQDKPSFVSYDLLTVVTIAACQDMDRRLRALEEQ